MIASSCVIPLALTLMGLSSPQIAGLVGGLTLIIVINRWRRNTVNRQHSKESASPIQSNGLTAREINTEMAALLGEIEETARRLTSQIDNRYRRLELMMAEADQKIARLEALLERTAAASASSNSAPAPAPAPSLPRPRPVALRKAETAKAETVNAEAQRVLERLREERGAPPATLDPAYKPIYALADGGKSAREIAQQLNRQPGEVELILALRQH